MSSWIKQAAMILFCISILMMSWEGQKTDAAMTTGGRGAVTSGVTTTGLKIIPHDSIRLRILANSDRPEDQLVKREIRDAIVQQMNTWVGELDSPQSLNQARALIDAHLPEIDHLVGAELARRGIAYAHQVELASVPFPTKMYGGLVYPAGNYEALRVTLGQGKGQNWWCVLFPPLCFIDAGSGEAAAQTVSAKTSHGDSRTKGTAKEPEVRFFLWDALTGLWSWVSGLFA
ncbi:stage II sporulation protein R [Paenibacillus sp. CMAA1739]|uniref:stage II sporulation protein R n=1 Tax=Paenibacillus ottowii TaxID=2315729 RepID=UPI00272F76A5|nr:MULTISPECIES: stage II sporulation protein R [Paenibacillus]MDP1510290.1 stage II sporulation protein R [Paenibacillus ottowii]MEC4565706.1 stage II sporulation protein R [Paenibacillus sp. CMAA1739]